MTAQLLDRDAALPLFEQLADRLEATIRTGALAPGDRLPSVRKLRAQFGVSMSTVLEALRRLEDRGLVVARPQSGHYVRHGIGQLPAEPGASRPDSRVCEVDLSLATRLNRAMLDPAQPIQLGAAIPDPDLLPLRTLNRLIGQVTREHPTLAHTYGAPPGTAALRHEIARRMIDAGVTVSPDEVVVTNGTKEAVYLSLRAVTEPGDAVAVESPTYYDLIETLHALHLRVLPVATHPRDGVSFDSLGEALHGGRVAAVMLVSNFSNPLGACMSDAKKQALVRMLDRYDVPLVEDDLYGDTRHHGPRPKAIKAFDTHGRVLYCSSLNKTVSPSLRLGWSIAGRHQPRIETTKRSLNQCNSRLLEMVAAEFLRSGGYDRHLRRMCRAYGEQMRRMIQTVGRHFPEGTRATRPQGGHVLWIEMPIGVDSIQLFEDAGRNGITLAPGPMFDVGRGYRHCIRLNCALRWSPQIEAAVATIGRLACEQLHSSGVPSASGLEPVRA